MTTTQLVNATNSVKRQYDHLMSDVAWASSSVESRAECIDDTLSTLSTASPALRDAIGHMLWKLNKRREELRGDVVQLTTR